MESQEYLAELERRCGKSADFLYDAMAEGGSGIGIMGFDNYPAVGEFTYFSYGLHRLEKPEWKYGVPEYFIVIDCPDRRIAAYFGHLILPLFPGHLDMRFNSSIGEESGVPGVDLLAKLL